MNSSKRLSFLVASITLLATGALIVPGLAEAQERRVKAGGKAAFNISRVRGEALGDGGEQVDFGTGNGFAFGGVLNIAAHDNVTFQPEVIYSSKEIDAGLTVDGIAATGEIETNWFEIPVLAKLHGSDNQSVRPFALLGATFSFLTGAELSVSTMGQTETEDIEDDLTGTDVGLTFGGGVDLVQDWGVVSIDARYTLGLRSLDEVDDLKQDTFAVSGAIIF